MIVDSSALLAILLDEADREELTVTLLAGGGRRMSAATYLETAMVCDRARDPILGRQLDALLEAARIQIEPVTARQAFIAREAFRDFGKGMGHPARLNFGDCFSYALAKDLDEPLLFKGGDFTHTDVRRAR